MDELDRQSFIKLLHAMVMKCFGHPLEGPLSEPESKHLSLDIEERTGLVIGWRSLKNYVAFALNPSSDKQENPSMPTLDTLARYVLEAPATSEAERKKTGEQASYWFRYREQLSIAPKANVPQAIPAQKQSIGYVVALVLIAFIFGFLLLHQSNLEQFEEDFSHVDEAELAQKGWFVQDINAAFWKRRTEQPGHLTLFTLKGDNWPKTGEAPRVQNLLLRDIKNDCFRTELHLNAFMPTGNWQQAGILLLEDTLFTGKSIRLSLAYNDFFGGLKHPAEILIQGTASYGKGDRNLEEFIHQPLFQLGSDTARRIASANMKNVAFRIEKQGQKFRFLYSASPVENSSFKEITTYEFGMKPRYVGLFALKGFMDSTANMPVALRYFRLEGQRCE
ncbi:hypothetical protein GCM10028806_10790 [Spirosoma terrae]|uniref:Beta-xylosidase C-terminal Concanavalin A-like domain-containing protein n=1 Tax=Spirosoma terrae TaxID=1968276 RepID=A0A6L9LGW9_9BACT|nr:hypothetical protein [Spirosoma terrae]NDU98947.1 hypothetical protein [Spirosoma terrae]